MRNERNDQNYAVAKTLELKYPVEWGSDGLIAELHFRRVKFKDLRATEKNKSETATAAELISRLTGMPPPFVDEMDAEDIAEAGKIIKGFMPKSKEDGDSGSDPSQEE